MVNMKGTGIADFENYQPPWSVNYAVIEKWFSGKDQIQSSARKNVFKDWNLGRGCKILLEILEESKVVLWKIV